jgi:hypothetical protein
MRGLPRFSSCSRNEAAPLGNSGTAEAQSGRTLNPRSEDSVSGVESVIDPSAFSGRSGFTHRSVVIVAILAWVTIVLAVGITTRWQGETPFIPPGQRIIDLQTAKGIESLQSIARTQSCSGSNCHGRIDEDVTEDKIRYDEYHVWLEDPHSHAYQTLSEERSLTILRNMGFAVDDFAPRPDLGPIYERHRKNCLTCHETNQQFAASSGQSLQPSSVFEGVSCESCHGQAEKWLDRHYLPEWKQSTTNEQKEQLGFVSNSGLPRRIQACTACHVGSPNGEVNHDLIAAGHPALRFEFEWYQSRLPRHWKPDRKTAVARKHSDNQTARSISATRRWLVAQLVTSIASLEQLERRLSGRGFVKTIPEFAEYKCFSCHHDLQGTSWRRDQDLLVSNSSSRKLSSQIPWGNWNLDLIPILADEYGSRDSSECAQLFRRLQAALESSSNESLQLSAMTRESLQKWLMMINQSPDLERDRMIHRLSQQKSRLLVSNWDVTANMLLGLAAYYRASNRIPQPLTRAMDHVRFPLSPIVIDSPAHFLSTTSQLRSVETQANLTVDQWIDLFKQLSELPPVDLD